MRIFLTGGTGLIGSHVAERLRRRGQSVVALVRRSSDRRHLDGLGCRLVEGDVLDDPDELASRMEGCDVVIHAAARVFERAGRKAFQRVNVGGTEAVLRAAALVAPRVIHLSSVAVYSRVRPDRLLPEERWAEADPARQAPYQASKTVSERLAWRLHGEGSIRLTTLRPAVVYGERDRAATPWMMRVAGLPLVPLPGGGRTRLPLVYAGNVARGVLAALDRDGSVGRAYNVAQDHPLTGRELVALLAHALDRRPRVLHLPVAPLTALAATVDGVTRWTPLPGTDLLRGVRSLTRDNPYDSSRARMELGWTNLVMHGEAIRRTVAWWRAGEGRA
jgi:2-alkyl-3-oxoalkanoate reductase